MSNTQNVETNNEKNGTEYVLVNGQDLFEVDYSEQTATLREDITLEDLEVNNDEYVDLDQFSLYEYLESNGFEVNEDKTTNDEQIYFRESE
jgi:hypothetical protein